jgi:hypothetical protein
MNRRRFKMENMQMSKTAIFLAMGENFKATILYILSTFLPDETHTVKGISIQ